MQSIPEEEQHGLDSPLSSRICPLLCRGRETGDHAYSRYCIGMHLLFGSIGIAFDIDRTWKNCVLISF